MTSKTYRYKGHTIAQTATVCLNNGRRCYEIEGAHGKRAAVRPFLTSLRAARDYIENRATIRALDMIEDAGLR